MKIGDKYIHQLPSFAKSFLLMFIIALSFGYVSGYKYLFRTTAMKADGIEINYNGNEEDENAEKMVFKKPEKEILTIIHTHVISMSLIFFCLGTILLFAQLPLWWKKLLLIEPFVSLITTFGGIWLMWNGVLWMKYIVMFSGILMTFSVISMVFTIAWQLYFYKAE